MNINVPGCRWDARVTKVLQRLATTAYSQGKRIASTASCVYHIEIVCSSFYT